MSKAIPFAGRPASAGQPGSAATRSHQRTRFRVVLGLLLIGFGLYVLMQLHFHKYGYFIVTSESMRPAINIGDRLVTFRSDQYHAGEIVVFPSPLNPSDLLVKRLVATGPCQIMVSRDRVFVDGQPADPPVALDPPDLAANPHQPDSSWTLKPGEVFVAGDNRAVSEDSRNFGPLSAEALRGAVRYRVERWYRWVKVQ